MQKWNDGPWGAGILQKYLSDGRAASKINQRFIDTHSAVNYQRVMPSQHNKWSALLVSRSIHQPDECKLQTSRSQLSLTTVQTVLIQNRTFVQALSREELWRKRITSTVDRFSFVLPSTALATLSLLLLPRGPMCIVYVPATYSGPNWPDTWPIVETWQVWVMSLNSTINAFAFRRDRTTRVSYELVL